MTPLPPPEVGAGVGACLVAILDWMGGCCLSGRGGGLGLWRGGGGRACPAVVGPKLMLPTGGLFLLLIVLLLILLLDIPEPGEVAVPGPGGVTVPGPGGVTVVFLGGTGKGRGGRDIWGAGCRPFCNEGAGLVACGLVFVFEGLGVALVVVLSSSLLGRGGTLTKGGKGGTRLCDTSGVSTGSFWSDWRRVLLVCCGPALLPAPSIKSGNFEQEGHVK